MGYIPPPQLAQGAVASYAETYSNIIARYRSDHLTSASSIVILAAADVDALCAARMLGNLFNQDDVIHRIIPIPGFQELQDIKEDILEDEELHTLILLNLGGLLDLSTNDWFAPSHPRVIIHVIDSLRPINLGNYFLADGVTVWDDGSADKFQELQKSFEIITFEPDYESDSADSVLEEEEDVEDSDQNEEQGDTYGERDSTTGKRQSLADGERRVTKRRRKSREPPRMTREQYRNHQERVDKYYKGGSFYGQSASGTIYILATALERTDSDLLWLAILGLTYQYTSSRISREAYDSLQTIYYDEVSRLNPPLPNGALTSLNPDDMSVRPSDELRFMLFRHWTLYDAMYHSSYIASKLGIWKERGRKKLIGLLAKMGFSMSQTQQPYSHMDMDLKKDLLQKLNDVAPEYGLVELSYPSFVRCYGYRSQPLSAADTVEAISALMDVAGGIRMEVEIEGMRNGGEWFSGGRAWEVNGSRDDTAKKRVHEQIKPDQPSAATEEKTFGATERIGKKGETRWWIRNFWTAFDALDSIDLLRDALKLSMSLHQAILRQGTSIIDKQDIRTMRNYRVVVLSQGPDLALFTHPGVLFRLALWLVDASRDRVPGGTIGTRTKRKSLPFVVACLNEVADTYMVVGVMAALDFGDVTKNAFGAAFLDAKMRCNTETQHTSFDASLLEIPQKDLKIFLEALCEGPD